MSKQQSVYKVLSWKAALLIMAIGAAALLALAVCVLVNWIESLIG